MEEPNITSIWYLGIKLLFVLFFHFKIHCISQSFSKKLYPSFNLQARVVSDIDEIELEKQLQKLEEENREVAGDDDDEDEYGDELDKSKKKAVDDDEDEDEEETNED